MKTSQAIKSQTLALLAGAAMLCAGGPAFAASYYAYSWSDGFADEGAIPDGSTVGWSDTQIISGIAEHHIADVDVWLDLSGGWNGDLYAYLTHSSGFSVLLNRVGRTGLDSFGYGDAGLSVTLDDSAVNGDIHRYQEVMGYETMIADGSKWQPDGRNLNPLVTVDTNPRTNLLDVFNGLDPNGSWTLFIADLSGGETTTVRSWGLVVGIPDGSETLVLLGLSLGTLMWIYRTARNKSQELET